MILSNYLYPILRTGYHDKVKQEGPLPRVRDDSARISQVKCSEARYQQDILLLGSFSWTLKCLTSQLLQAKSYKPSNAWSPSKALAGQNDYIGQFPFFCLCSIFNLISSGCLRHPWKWGVASEAPALPRPQVLERSSQEWKTFSGALGSKTNGTSFCHLDSTASSKSFGAHQVPWSLPFKVARMETHGKWINSLMMKIFLFEENIWDQFLFRLCKIIGGWIVGWTRTGESGYRRMFKKRGYCWGWLLPF